MQSAASLSDIDGAVLLRNNIHLKVCTKGKVNKTFGQLKDSPATQKNKVKFVLATDGLTVEAEDLSGEPPLVCEYADFPNHFGYFLPLAGGASSLLPSWAMSAEKTNLPIAYG